MDTETVDEAGNALGVVIDAGDGIVGKKGAAEMPGELDMVTDVSRGLSKIKRGEVIDGGEALEKCLMGSKAQNAAQFRLADEEERSEGLAVHAGGEKQAELFEGGVGQEVSLVKDDQRNTALALDEFIEDRTDGGDHFGPAEEGRVAECSEQFAINAGHTEEGVGEVNHGVAVGVEGGDKPAHSGGFAGSGLAGEQAQAALAGKVIEAGGSFHLSISRKEVIGGNIAGKGLAIEGVELLEHHVISPDRWKWFCIC